MRKNKQNLMSKLIFLCLITTSIVTTLSLSKFYTTSTSENSVKVAIYSVNAYAEDTKDLTIDCAVDNDEDVTESCSYVVTNESEVAVAYKIKVDLGEQELPVGITLNVKDEQGRTGTMINRGNSYIFENELWKFEPDEIQSNNITITFTGENIENATSTIISNVQVSVIVEQID